MAKKDPGAVNILPYALSLYFDMKEHNALLVSGGILDQPDWLWHITKRAGIIYENLMTTVREDWEFEKLANQNRIEAIQNAIKAKMQEN